MIRLLIFIATIIIGSAITGNASSINVGLGTAVGFFFPSTREKNQYLAFEGVPWLAEGSFDKHPNSHNYPYLCGNDGDPIFLTSKTDLSVKKNILSNEKTTNHFLFHLGEINLLYNFFDTNNDQLIHEFGINIRVISSWTKLKLSSDFSDNRIITHSCFPRLFFGFQYTLRINKFIFFSSIGGQITKYKLKTKFKPNQLKEKIDSNMHVNLKDGNINYTKQKDDYPAATEFKNLLKDMEVEEQTYNSNMKFIFAGQIGLGCKISRRIDLKMGIEFLAGHKITVNIDSNDIKKKLAQLVAGSYIQEENIFTNQKAMIPIPWSMRFNVGINFRIYDF